MDLMTKSIAIACALALTTAPGTALAWNAATHAYIAGALHKKAGQTADPQLLRNRMYGANGPDVFNYAFGQPFFTIADYLHEYVTPDATLRAWDAARTSGDANLIAYAYGFVSHDNAFGADTTAHVEAITGAVKQGYVIAKAALLAQALRAVLAQQQMDLPEDQLLLGAHVLVEAAVDLLVQAQLDPEIGVKLRDAVDLADPRIGDLLAAAYRAPLARYFAGGEAEAAATIVYVESQFRGIEHQYAEALAASRPDAFGPLAQFNAALAERLFDMPAAALYPLVEFGVGQAMTLVQDDFQREIFATIRVGEREPRLAGRVALRWGGARRAPCRDARLALHGWLPSLLHAVRAGERHELPLEALEPLAEGRR